MALALRPKLLLLDEPTAGMSPEETYQTGELILTLNASGMTMLVVEHDMTFVRQIAKVVTVLHFGRVFARGFDRGGHQRSSAWLKSIWARPAMSTEAFLEVSGLWARYGATPILQGVDLAVNKGEIVSLIGRNGVGKTTTMRCLIGLLGAAAGKVQFPGARRHAPSCRESRAPRHGLHPAGTPRVPSHDGSGKP